MLVASASAATCSEKPSLRCSRAAHEMLEKLPLGQAHLMTFELIPLGPLNPLRELQGMAAGSP